MKAGIVTEKRKVPIFERHLTQAGYTYTKVGPKNEEGLWVISVQTDNPRALAIVVQAANDEAAGKGMTQ